MTLLLIRHGETDLNTGRVVQFPDTPLGAVGLDQAERLAARLAARRLGLIVSSDYQRARMTAARVAAASGARVVESPHWRERNFGDLRGRAYDDLGELDIFAKDYHPPGGESWPDFDARVDRAWADLMTLAEEVEQDIAVVTHGLVLRSLFERVLDCSGHLVTPDIVVANTSVTTVERVPPWRVAELAAVHHLEEVVRGGGAV